MEVKEVDSIIEKLNNIQNTYGIGGVILIITLVVILLLSWKYLTKSSELIAEEASEKSLKKFQTQLDKDLIKFQTKHQKQVDAIHETFQKFQKMTSTINFLLNGENFSRPPDAREEIFNLINNRQDFKAIYNQNRLIFPVKLCSKIDELIPSIDEFINTFSNGLFPEQSEQEKEYNSEQNGGLFIAGLWSSNAFETVLEQLKQTSNEIEIEFRKIYGTNE
jgi:hypothetical protein